MNVCMETFKSHRAVAQRIGKKRRECPGKTEQEGQEVEGRCREGDKRRGTEDQIEYQSTGEVAGKQGHAAYFP